MKKKTIPTIFGLVMLLLCANSCIAPGNNTEHSEYIAINEHDYHTVDVIAYKQNIADYPKILCSDITETQSPSGTNLMFAGDYSLYYIQCVFEGGGSIPVCINCYEYDLRSRLTRLLYSASDERCVSKDYCYANGKIFYIVLNNDGSRIECYDIRTCQRTVLAQFDEKVEPSLSGCGDYITWYIDNGRGGISVWGYQIAANERFLICDDIVAFSPATISRVGVGGITAFLTMEKDKYCINIYDLVGRETIKTYMLNYNTMISRIEAESRYLVFTDVVGPETVNCTTNIIDLRTDVAYRITIDGAQVDVCDYLLLGDELDLIYYGADQTNGKLFSYVYNVNLSDWNAKLYEAYELYSSIAQTGSNYLLALNSMDGSVTRLRDGGSYAVGWTDLNRSVDRDNIESISICHTNNDSPEENVFRDGERIDTVYDVWFKYVSGHNIDIDEKEIKESIHVVLRMYDGESFNFDLLNIGKKCYLRQYRYMENKKGFYYKSEVFDVVEMSPDDYYLMLLGS